MLLLLDEIDRYCQSPQAQQFNSSQSLGMELYEKWVEAYQMLADQKGKVLLPIRERRCFSFIKDYFSYCYRESTLLYPTLVRLYRLRDLRSMKSLKETKRTKISSDHNNV